MDKFFDKIKRAVNSNIVLEEQGNPIKIIANLEAEFKDLTQEYKEKTAELKVLDDKLNRELEDAKKEAEIYEKYVAEAQNEANLEDTMLFLEKKAEINQSLKKESLESLVQAENKLLQRELDMKNKLVKLNGRVGELDVELYYFDKIEDTTFKNKFSDEEEIPTLEVLKAEAEAIRGRIKVYEEQLDTLIAKSKEVKEKAKITEEIYKAKYNELVSPIA